MQSSDRASRSSAHVDELSASQASNHAPRTTGIRIASAAARCGRGSQASCIATMALSSSKRRTDRASSFSSNAKTSYLPFCCETPSPPHLASDNRGLRSSAGMSITGSTQRWIAAASEPDSAGCRKTDSAPPSTSKSTCQLMRAGSAGARRRADELRKSRIASCARSARDASRALLCVGRKLQSAAEVVDDSKRRRRALASLASR